MIQLDQFYRKNYNKHLKKISRILYRDKDLAKDIVQQAYVRAFENKDKYDKKRGSLNTWFNLMLFSTLRDFQRKMKDEPVFLSLSEPKVLHEIESFQEQSYALSYLKDMIESEEMSDKNREVLYLYYVLGFTNKEVAAIMDLSVSNVTTICNRYKRSKSIE